MSVYVASTYTHVGMNFVECSFPNHPDWISQHEFEYRSE